ncbi:MAG: diguanylate cyclase [Treponema sp.]|nr:diguanylate cyclase [Treponema sp.]
MFKKSFKIKIIIPISIILITLVVVLNIFLSLRFTAFSDSLVQEKLVANINSLRLFLDDSKANSLAAAISMTYNSDIVKAIKEQNRNELLRLLSHTQNTYRIDFFTICDNEGIVLARIHEPDNFGDSISYQQNIKDALNGKISSYFEAGTVVKVSIRTGAPVYDTDGILIGVVSAGIRFDTEDTVEGLKRLLNSEITVFFGNTRIASTITMNGQSIVGTTLDPHIAEIVIDNKQEYSGRIDILGEKYDTFYKPLLNANDEAFAVIFLGIPEMKLITASTKSIRDGIILGLSGLAVSIVLLYYIISSISKPITKLSDSMNNIANGNLNIDVQINGEDEVGLLGKSLQKMAVILQKLLEGINTMIAEQKKGNTDYCLDTGDFSGDYKILANSVLELTAFGMIDQLTGIPNRRSFDNRLDLEWNRAIREKDAISIMIIDVDKFKNYNDTFGHQQGDVALKTTAKTIKQTIKRAMDFAARWGGEEFIVLLPSTDSAGAVCVAEKIRMEIENMIIPCTDLKGTRLTVSIGVNTLIPVTDSPIDRFLSVADTALYKAKETGRNRAVFGGEIL